MGGRECCSALEDDDGADDVGGKGGSAVCPVGAQYNSSPVKSRDVCRLKFGKHEAAKYSSNILVTYFEDEKIGVCEKG